ncbi:hypothetical protein M378DRAFT_186925 [Amanita muscaria Koide BX008]|uniref:S-adenosyl-L-methionine-dependent methyltransferase n=1 Tax=Amanita muscaria (strain Koide BX008) TaxID=946122 RepID=A0A0C2SKD3_AMAMK|nr:hypothetical protein M378DRAFT_186925 [Amanita muscaria Koide BX008]
MLHPLTDLYLSVLNALLPTIKSLINSPVLISQLSAVFMSHVWEALSNGVDQNGKPVKQHLITPHAQGTVLDLGAGHGHTVFYLDRAKVTNYIALEPNTLMHPRLRQNANKAGFHEHDGTLLILSCGAENTEHILSAIGWTPVDTLVSVLTLCTVPDPPNTLRALVEHVLKPGGQFLYYEHVLSHRPDVARWQRFWAPVWAVAFDGCRMDRPTQKYIDEATEWRERSVWGKEGEPEENLFYHRVGKYYK